MSYPLVIPCSTPPADCYPCYISPIANLSSELPDSQVYIGMSWNSQQPPIDPVNGDTWDTVGCLAVCTSTISQEDADLCAQRQQIYCNTGSWRDPSGNPIPIYLNQQAACTVKCPDGLPFTFTVHAGTFAALSQVLADRMAFSYACNNATRHRICLSAISPTTGSTGIAYSGRITASGINVITPLTWSVISGSLPPGLNLGGFSPDVDVTVGKTETISGIPTVAGAYTFTLRCTDADGDFMDKAYTITIAQTIGIPTAYWTLDEAAASTDRIDSVTSLHLAALGVTEAGTPAKISNGVPFEGSFGGAGYSTGATATLKHTAGNSFSIIGWFRINSTGPGNLNGGPSVAYSFNGFSLYIAVGDSLGTQDVRVDSVNDTAFISGISSSAWHFFHIFYDVTQQKHGYSIDAAAESLLPTPIVYASSVDGQIALNQNWSGATGSIVFDEVGIYASQKLNSTQISYLYNSGAAQRPPL